MNDQDNLRAPTVSTGRHGQQDIPCCAICGALLGDIDKHYQYTHPEMREYRS